MFLGEKLGFFPVVLKVAGETPVHVTGYANIEVYGNIAIRTCFPCENTKISVFSQRMRASDQTQ